MSIHDPNGSERHETQLEQVEKLLDAERKAHAATLHKLTHLSTCLDAFNEGWRKEQEAHAATQKKLQDAEECLRILPTAKEVNDAFNATRCTPAEREVLDAMASLVSSHLRDWVKDAESNYPRAPDGLIRNVRIRSTVTAFKAELARRGETP